MTDNTFPDIQNVVTKLLFSCSLWTTCSMFGLGKVCTSKGKCADYCTTNTRITDAYCVCGSSKSDPVAFMGQTCKKEGDTYSIICAEGKIDLRNLLKGAVQILQDGGTFTINDQLEAGISNSLVGFATQKCLCGENKVDCQIGDFCMNNQCYCVPFIYSYQRCNCASEITCGAKNVCMLEIWDDIYGYGRIVARCYNSGDDDELLETTTTLGSTKMNEFVQYSDAKSIIVGCCIGATLAVVLAFMLAKLYQKKIIEDNSTKSKKQVKSD